MCVCVCVWVCMCVVRARGAGVCIMRSCAVFVYFLCLDAGVRACTHMHVYMHRSARRNLSTTALNSWLRVRVTSHGVMMWSFCLTAAYVLSLHDCTTGDC